MRKFLTTGALLVACLAALASLDPLISVNLWGPLAGIVLASAALPLILLRIATRWALWPTLIALSTSIVAIGIFFHREHPELSWGQPREFLPALARVLLDGVDTLRTQSPPVVEGSGVAVLVAIVVVLIFLSSEALGVGAESPALAGIPVAALWLPSVVLSSPAPLWAMATCLGAHTLALGLGRPAASQPRLALPTIAAVTALAAAMSAFGGPLAWQRLEIGQAPGTGGSSTRLDLGLNIRDHLVRGSNERLITYSGIAPAVLGPLHSHTIADFDGTRWQVSAPAEWIETTQAWAEDSAALLDLDAPPQSVTFEITDLAQNRIFLPAAPREFSAPVAYDPVQDTARLEPGAQVRYTLSGPPLDLTAENLAELSGRPRTPAGAADYLNVPSSSHAEQIQTLTQQVIAGAESPLAKGRAIQNFLRFDPQFQYTTTLGSAQSDDAVWDFLTDGRGYCVQFATAMVIMARNAGIPARLAVGFLPGDSELDPDGNQGGVIMSHHAHAWPQLHLGEAGWVRFEPTPSVRSGAQPDYTVDPASEPSPTHTPTPHITPSEPATSAEPPAQTSPGPNTEDDSSFSTWLVVLLLALVTLAGSALTLAFLRRKRNLHVGVEEAWTAAVAALAPLGLLAEGSDTPTRVYERAEGIFLTQDGTAALTGLQALTTAVNNTRYSPAPREYSESELSAWVEQTKALAAEASH